MENCPDCGVPMVGIRIFEDPITCPDCGRPGTEITAVFKCPHCHILELVSVAFCWPDGHKDYRAGARYERN